MRAGNGRLLAGRYHLECVLGSGASGEVWKAEDRLHDRPVAIKFLKPEVVASSPMLLRKFQQEARIGAVIGHPGIVRADDFGEYDGRWYLVMEFLHGRNLQEEISDHPCGLPLPRLLSLGAQIADALSAAHARGIVHRDLKPANIMLTVPDQASKICDFGIAHLAEAATVNTLTGKPAGTPLYMAPEQWLGESVDSRTDLYALGGTLYTLLTGAPAFKGPLLALKAQHLDTPPAPPGTVRPGLPAGLEPLILQLLAKDPDDRPNDATEVTDRLRRLAEPTATIWVSTSGTAETRASAPVFAASPRPGSLERAPHMLEGTPPRFGRPTRRTVLLSLGATALFAPAAYLLKHTSPSSPQIGEPLTDRVSSVAFSPDGKSLASVGSLDGAVRLWSVADRSQIGELLTGHKGAVSSVAFSPDSKSLASVGSLDDAIRLWNVADRSQIGELLSGAVYNVAFSPDGKILASGQVDDSMVRLWNIANPNQLSEPLTGQAEAVTSVAFSPDGKTLASGGLGGTVCLWNVANRTQIGEPLTGHQAHVGSVAFSPDGKTLASGSLDSTVRLWNVANRTQIGEPLTRRTGSALEDDAVSSVVFSPDGKTLATGSSRGIRLWNVANQSQIGKTLTGHKGEVNSVAFSPDGKTLASGGDDKTVRLWRL